VSEEEDCIYCAKRAKGPAIRCLDSECLKEEQEEEEEEEEEDFSLGTLRSLGLPQFFLSIRPLPPLHSPHIQYPFEAIFDVGIQSRNPVKCQLHSSLADL
jgi:hypothetical protein